METVRALSWRDFEIDMDTKPAQVLSWEDFTIDIDAGRDVTRGRNADK